VRYVEYIAMTNLMNRCSKHKIPFSLKGDKQYAVVVLISLTDFVSRASPKLTTASPMISQGIIALIK